MSTFYIMKFKQTKPSTVVQMNYPTLDGAQWSQVGSNQFATTQPFAGRLVGGGEPIEGTTTFTLTERPSWTTLTGRPEPLSWSLGVATKFTSPPPREKKSSKGLSTPLQTLNGRLMTGVKKMIQTGPKTFQIGLADNNSGAYNSFSSSFYQNYGGNLRLEREGEADWGAFMDKGPYLPTGKPAPPLV